LKNEKVDVFWGTVYMNSSAGWLASSTKNLWIMTENENERVTIML